MVVAGRNVAIMHDTGRRAEISPFTPDYDSLHSIPVTDAAIRHDCPFSGDALLLIVRNALSVPAMGHNLIPPFIIRIKNKKIKTCLLAVLCARILTT